MKLDNRYSNHPNDVKKYTTSEIREHFLMERVFVEGEIALTYSHNDRIIAGGVVPTTKKLALVGGKELGTDNFLDRREMGVINIGGKGTVLLDGKEYVLDTNEGLYAGLGIKTVEFVSADAKNPAKFYVNSCPAHKTFPTVLIDKSKANKVDLGDQKTLNQRTIFQFVHPAVCESCQLVMGMTVLAPGSAWNTMPCHTHERRMEVYLYFGMEEDTRVFHMMGEADETRHIVMKNEEAVISPSWSIHSGVGTSDYTFIWGMCGENQTFTDMDHIEMKDLK